MKWNYKRIMTMVMAMTLMAASMSLSAKTVKADAADAVSVSITQNNGTTLTMSSDTIAEAGVSEETVFTPSGDEAGVFYNETKQDAALTYGTDGTLTFTLGSDITPATGDKIKVTGSFTSDDITINVTEYSMLYNGTKWVQYLTARYIWLNAPRNSEKFFMKLNTVIGTDFYVDYSPLTEDDGVFYNGVRVDSAALELQEGCQTVCYKLGSSAAAGDTITIKGKFTRNNICVDITECSFYWNGDKWIAITYEYRNFSYTRQIGTTWQIKLNKSPGNNNDVFTSLSASEGLLYNGEWIPGAKVTVTNNGNDIYYKPSNPVKGDVITIDGRFLSGTRCLDISPLMTYYYSWYFDGTNWVQKQGSNHGTAGDLNFDGSSDLTDLVRLKKYVDNDVTYIFKNVSNVNEDSVVDINDVTQLRSNILNALYEADNGI